MKKLLFGIMLSTLTTLPIFAQDILKCTPSEGNDLDEAGIELIIDFDLNQVAVFSIAGVHGAECELVEQDVLRCEGDLAPLEGSATLKLDRNSYKLSVSIEDEFDSKYYFDCID